MKPTLLWATILLVAVTCFYSCGSKDKKGAGKETTAVLPGKEIVPAIDIAGLKDEASILTAMQQVVDARLKDEKLQKENPDYPGYYLELTKLYTEVVSASTTYSRTISDPAKAVEFGNRLSAIQDKMYTK